MRALRRQAPRGAGAGNCRHGGVGRGVGEIAADDDAVAVVGERDTENAGRGTPDEGRGVNLPGAPTVMRVEDPPPFSSPTPDPGVAARGGQPLAPCREPVFVASTGWHPVR